MNCPNFQFNAKVDAFSKVFLVGIRIIINDFWKKAKKINPKLLQNLIDDVGRC